MQEQDRVAYADGAVHLFDYSMMRQSANIEHAPRCCAGRSKLQTSATSSNTVAAICISFERPGN